MTICKEKLLPYLFFVLACSIMCPLSLNSQISSSGYVSVVETGYEIEFADTTIHENIFIFCGEKGNLSADMPEGEGDLTFEWSEYNDELPGYEPPFHTFLGETSNISDLESGGYQVKITDGNVLDTIFRAWIFVNQVSVSVEIARHDCSVLDLTGNIETDAFYYYNPLNNTGYILPQEYGYSWSADPSIPVPDALNPRIWDPPPVTTRYTLSANSYGCEREYTLTEDPLTTRAGFTLEPAEGEAPLEIRFDAGISLNAKEYEWYFDYQPGDEETGAYDANISDPEHTYYIPGEYYVALRTVAGLCDDVFRYPEPVTVYFSELEVPNVFSPGIDGYNDLFMVRAVSMREYHVVIYNRNGKKVFETEDPEEGWDGRISGGFASPGVYFYIITGMGWDEREYEFRGPLHLYRR